MRISTSTPGQAEVVHGFILNHFLIQESSLCLQILTPKRLINCFAKNFLIDHQETLPQIAQGMYEFHLNILDDRKCFVTAISPCFTTTLDESYAHQLSWIYMLFLKMIRDQEHVEYLFLILKRFVLFLYKRPTEEYLNFALCYTQMALLESVGLGEIRDHLKEISDKKICSNSFLEHFLHRRITKSNFLKAQLYLENCLELYLPRKYASPLFVT